MTQIYKYDELDLSKMEVAIPDKQNDIYYSPLKYDGKPFYLQTSKLDIITNCNELNGESPSIEFEICGDNFDMYDLFMKLDDKLVKSTYHNSEEWFNQITLLSKKMLNENYKVKDIGRYVDYMMNDKKISKSELNKMINKYNNVVKQIFIKLEAIK